MEFNFTNNGSIKFCYDGFMYTKQAIRKPQIWYKCLKRSRNGCLGSKMTNLQRAWRTRPTPQPSGELSTNPFN